MIVCNERCRYHHLKSFLTSPGLETGAHEPAPALERALPGGSATREPERVPPLRRHDVKPQLERLQQAQQFEQLAGVALDLN